VVEARAEQAAAIKRQRISFPPHIKALEGRGGRFMNRLIQLGIDSTIVTKYAGIDTHLDEVRVLVLIRLIGNSSGSTWEGDG
jgi:hypothetical protein